MEKQNERGLSEFNLKKQPNKSITCSCGARIPGDKIYCPRCGARRPKVWRCSKCGFLTTKEGTVCPTCGGRLTEIVSTTTEKPKVNKRGGVFILLAAVLAMAAIILLCFGPGKNNKTTKLEALNNAIQEKINEEMIEGDGLPANLQYVNAMLNAITFEVKSNSERKSSAQVEFTYVDALALAESFGGEKVTSDTYFAYCVEQINGGTAAMGTKKIAVEYEVIESDTNVEYNIIVNEELIDILCGGAYFYYLDMLEEVAFQ